MGNTFLYLFEIIYSMEQSVVKKFVGMFKKKEPAYKYFSKHAMERLHCREYDR